MTSQLRQNFQASQAVHRADDISTPHFGSMSISEHLWSLSYLLDRAGVPNLIILTLVVTLNLC